MSLAQFIDEPVLVQIRWQADGAVQPAAFVWRGRTHAIRDVGRQWDEMAGGDRWRCYLVRTAENETFELRFSAATAAWRLQRAWLRTTADI